MHFKLLGWPVVASVHRRKNLFVKLRHRQLPSHPQRKYQVDFTNGSDIGIEWRHLAMTGACKY